MDIAPRSARFIGFITNRPASTEVARLVDLRNLFAGTIAGHGPKDRTVIDWVGVKIETTARPEFALGQDVSWVVPDGFVVLHRRDRPSRGEHENPVPGTVEADPTATR